MGVLGVVGAGGGAGVGCAGSGVGVGWPGAGGGGDGVPGAAGGGGGGGGGGAGSGATLAGGIGAKRPAGGVLRSTEPSSAERLSSLGAGGAIGSETGGGCGSVSLPAAEAS